MAFTKKVVVLGAGGFIGAFLARRLKEQGAFVIGVDIHAHLYMAKDDFCNVFVLGDLRNPTVVASVITPGVHEVYQLAADMGGADFVFTGTHDAEIMHNSALINLNVVQHCVTAKVKRVFYSSSACVYPARNQTNPLAPDCAEHTAYPAEPDSEYGWEKLFSERLYQTFARCHGLQVRIARFHNIFGPLSTFSGGREKAPAALCRKIAELPASGGTIQVYGDGTQTRSFLYIDECVDGILRLMASDHNTPINIGSDECVSIKELVRLIAGIAEKPVHIEFVDGPVGVKGRNSDNTLVKRTLAWAPSSRLRCGLQETYTWIAECVKSK
jgi:GDP-D-mannose 3',5'-epimerase